MSDAPTNLPPAGWYPDTTDATSERWWDGAAWTDQRRPIAPTPPPPPAPTEAAAPAPAFAPPSGEPAPGYAAPAADAAPGYAPPTAGPGYAAPAPAPGYQLPTGTVKRSSGLGLAAVIVGAVAFIGSFIPFVDYGTVLLAIVGVVLAIIGFVQKNRSRILPIVGGIISAVALLLSIALAIVYTISISSAVNDTVKSYSIGGATGTAPTGAAGSSNGVGTRKNPAPIGSDVTLTQLGKPRWKVTPQAPNLDATADVAKANSFNDVPPAGSVWVILPVKATYLGDDKGSPIEIQVTFVGSDGKTYDTSSGLADLPNSLELANELYNGASETGDVAIIVPSSVIAGGTWDVAGIMGGDDYYFAAQ